MRTWVVMITRAEACAASRHFQAPTRDPAGCLSARDEAEGVPTGCHGARGAERAILIPNPKELCHLANLITTIL